MEASEYSIITAPVPINRVWWLNLTVKQRVSLIAFMLLYICGTLTVTGGIFVDRFYQYNLTLKSMQLRRQSQRELIVQYQVTVSITRGFWREDIDNHFNFTNNDPTRRAYFLTHAAVGLEIWENCWIRSIRGGPCHRAAIYCLVLGLLIMYYHCTTITLFRIFMIMNSMVAAILLMVSFGMEYSSASEYDFCVRNMMTHSKNKKRFVRGRYFKPSLKINGETFYLMLIGNFGIFLPMLALGCYLIFCNRKNL